MIHTNGLTWVRLPSTANIHSIPLLFLLFFPTFSSFFFFLSFFFVSFFLPFFFIFYCICTFFNFSKPGKNFNFFLSSLNESPYPILSYEHHHIFDFTPCVSYAYRLTIPITLTMENSASHTPSSDCTFSFEKLYL